LDRRHEDLFCAVDLAIEGCSEHVAVALSPPEFELIGPNDCELVYAIPIDIAGLRVDVGRVLLAWGDGERVEEHVLLGHVPHVDHECVTRRPHPCSQRRPPKGEPDTKYLQSRLQETRVELMVQNVATIDSRSVLARAIHTHAVGLHFRTLHHDFGGFGHRDRHGW
jgi:hypothetical protein